MKAAARPSTGQQDTSLLPAGIEPLWRVGQVEAYLGISRHTVYEMTARGELKSVLVGRQRRWLPESIHAHVTGSVLA